MVEIETVPAGRKSSGWFNVMIDYGPLLIFLGVYKWYAPEGGEPIGELAAIIRGTVAFMIAALIAIAISKWRLGKVSPMLWFSTALIVGFGALTVFFGDPVFVQLKPTIIYGAFGAVLLIGVWRGKALLQILLEAAFAGLAKEGWLKLSRNWGVFFLVLAALNEALRAYLSFEGWLWAKLWVFLPLSFLFTFSQLPMLLRHGLNPDDMGEGEHDPPSTG